MSKSQSGGAVAGKTVVVTGGGSGIGRAMVEAFAAEGAKVIAVDLNEERLRQLTLELGAVDTVLADISTPEGADRVIAAAGERLHVLCNNAGVIDSMELAEEMAEDRWDKVIAVNLTGPFLLCKRALPRMVAHGEGGVIINTGSTAATRGGRGGVAYTASKWGLHGMTQNIAATYADRGIRCVMISPGRIDTNLASSMDSEMPPGGALALFQKDGNAPPIGRPDEIASVAVFLASDAASRVNGVNIPVDRGWQAY
jgi:NAD(P)-dependent dehydrogenase (short-subunit alcohol dehydrogenase family)